LRYNQTAKDANISEERGIKMFTGKLTIVPTFTMKAGVFGSRFLPRQVLAFMTGHQQKKKTDNI
jgi:uncharacterized protein